MMQDRVSDPHRPWSRDEGGSASPLRPPSPGPRASRFSDVWGLASKGSTAPGGRGMLDRGAVEEKLRCAEPWWQETGAAIRRGVGWRPQLGSAASAVFPASCKNPTVRSSGLTGPGSHVEWPERPGGPMSPPPACSLPTPSSLSQALMAPPWPLGPVSIPALRVGAAGSGLASTGAPQLEWCQEKAPASGQVRPSRWAGTRSGGHWQGRPCARDERQRPRSHRDFSRDCAPQTASPVLRHLCLCQTGSVFWRSPGL